MLKHTIFGKGGPPVNKINTLIGGCALTSIKNKQNLATALGINQNNIPIFNIVNTVDIEASINIDYDLPDRGINGYVDITHFKDLDGRIINIGFFTFSHCPKLTEVYLPGALKVGGSFFYSSGTGGDALKYIYAPKVNSIGTKVFTGADPGIPGEASTSFQLIPIYTKIYLGTGVLTEYFGKLNKNLLNIEGINLTRYVTSFDLPDDVIDLSVGTSYNTSAKLLLTEPASVNPIDYYEVYVNDIYSHDTSKLDLFVTGLLPSATYNVKVRAVDIFMNKSKQLSNEINVTIGAGNIGFISKWDTNKQAPTNQITLPIPNTGYEQNFIVDWGDGTTSVIDSTTNISTAKTHTYSVGGIYTLKITGLINCFGFGTTYTPAKLIEILSWGGVRLSNKQSFYNCTNLKLDNVTDFLDFHNCLSVNQLFYGCKALTIIPNISSWLTGNITNFGSIFRGCDNFIENVNNVTFDNAITLNQAFAGNYKFNSPLNNLNISNVINMVSTFDGCYAFDQPLNNWNTTNVTNINGMFRNCLKFNQNIDSWNVSKVTDISSMFQGCVLFSFSINSWNTINVTNMSNTFQNCVKFDQPLNNWNTSNVTNMTTMFQGCSIFNQDINSWNVSNVKIFSGIFIFCVKFNSPLNLWNTSNVTAMDSAFQSCLVFDQNINAWNTSKVTVMSSMFQGCSVYNQPLDTWNTSNVSSFSNMFNNAQRFNQNIDSWNVSKSKQFVNMFRNCVAFNQPLNSWIFNTLDFITTAEMFNRATIFDQPLNNWNTTKFTTGESMFKEAYKFNQDLNNWDTSNMTSFFSMFNNATLFNGNISTWNTANVTTMQSMFSFTNNFNQPLNSWNTSKVTLITGMFQYAIKFNQDLDNWNTSLVTSFNSLFQQAEMFTGNISTWNTSNVNTMVGTFNNALKFNGNISAWDTSKVTSFMYMFQNAVLFNQPIGVWNTANVTNMYYMFFNNYNKIAFNQNIGNWNVSNVTDFTNFMFANNPSLSPENLDLLYNGWATRTVIATRSIVFSFAKYTSASLSARNILTGAPNYWSITDGGML